MQQPTHTLHAFDFDGTITTRDTLLEFIRYERGIWGLITVLLRYLPQLLLMKLHLYSNERAKQQVFSTLFRGMSLEEFDAHCCAFAASNTHLLRPAAVCAIKQVQESGDTVVVISASIENWVRPFLPDVDIQGTQIEVKEDKLTGRFLTPNCYGPEKVRRLLAKYPDRKSYHLIAYGDSKGDKDLLAFADDSHYRPFRTV